MIQNHRIPLSRSTDTLCESAYESSCLPAHQRNCLRFRSPFRESAVLRHPCNRPNHIRPSSLLPQNTQNRHTMRRRNRWYRTSPDSLRNHLPSSRHHSRSAASRQPSPPLTVSILFFSYSPPFRSNSYFRKYPIPCRSLNTNHTAHCFILAIISFYHIPICALSQCSVIGLFGFNK